MRVSPPLSACATTVCVVPRAIPTMSWDDPVTTEASSLRTNAELDAPAFVRFARPRGHGFEQERADLRHRRVQLHRHDLAFGAPFGRKDDFDRRQLLELTVGPSFELDARAIVATHRGSEEAEAHRLADDDPDFVRRKLGRRALLHSERSDAERHHRRL